MYEYADELIKILNKRFVMMFDDFKGSLLGMDEVNALQKVQSLYRDLDELVRETLFRLALMVYEEWGGDDVTAIGNEFLAEVILDEYDPVLKYVYTNEVERKASRLFEALIATGFAIKEIDNALRLWSLMVGQYAITTTDEAALQAYRVRGVDKVIWKAKKDGRQCSVCDERDGNIYPIDEVPPKPHIGCRCEILPYEKEEE